MPLNITYKTYICSLSGIESFEAGISIHNVGSDDSLLDIVLYRGSDEDEITRIFNNLNKFN